MPIQIRLARIAATCAVIALPVCAHANLRFDGIARAPTDGRVLYRETHWLYADAAGPSRLVLFRCADGRPFARKRMLEAPDPTAPSFDYVDARSGYREGVRARGAAREMFVQSNASATPSIAPLRGDRAVIDAGFDAWVRLHWNAIGRDGTVVPFVVPSRGGTLDFRLRDAGTTRDGGRVVRRFRMGLAGLLGLALPEVTLDYDAADRRLLRFTGPSTVRDANGRLQRVRVDFDAPPASAGAGAADVDAALRAPLVTRCAS